MNKFDYILIIVRNWMMDILSLLYYSLDFIYSFKNLFIKKISHRQCGDGLREGRQGLGGGEQRGQK